MDIVVIRMGHRVPRDERMTTHIALVSRIFGVKEVIYSGMKDDGFERSIERICKQWGGNVDIKYVKNIKRFIEFLANEQGNVIVHLTMYGERIENIIEEIKEVAWEKRIFIIIGSEKVPSWVYNISTYNVGVTNQPHSEIAALTLFLDRLINGKELNVEFEREITKGAKVRVIPKKRGKKIERIN